MVLLHVRGGHVEEPYPIRQRRRDAAGLRLLPAVRVDPEEFEACRWRERLRSGVRRYQAVPFAGLSSEVTARLADELEHYRPADTRAVATQALIRPLREISSGGLRDVRC